MLNEEHRAMLVRAYERFKQTGDRDEFHDALDLVKLLAPEKFFHGDKDPRLDTRIFVHMPFSTYWSGRALTNKIAWPVGTRT